MIVVSFITSLPWKIAKSIQNCMAYQMKIVSIIIQIRNVNIYTLCFFKGLTDIILSAFEVIFSI